MTLTTAPADLAFYTARRRWAAELGAFMVFVGGNSRASPRPRPQWQEPEPESPRPRPGTVTNSQSYPPSRSVSLRMP